MKYSVMQNSMRIVGYCLALIVCSDVASAKRNDDVVVLKNGDHLTGEIKGLQRGELRFKSSYMVDAVRLDWAKVERLESKDKFLIFLMDGKLFTDLLNLDTRAIPNFVIGAEKKALRVNQMDVVKISPVEESFWSQ